MLLSALLFLFSTATLHAQGNNTLPLTKAQVRQSCTAFHSFFVVNGSSCTTRKLSQKELAVKAAVSNEEEVKLPTVSYSIESVYYAEPTPTPKEVITTPSPEVTKPLLTEARDMIPQVGVTVDSNAIFDLINSHRASIGKPAFLKDEALCSLAQARSIELTGEFANGTLHSGLYNRALPYWITEDAKWGSNESGTVRWWLNSPIHRRAIEGDYIYSCGACNGSQCAQLFTSYTPKQYVPTPTPLTVASIE